MTIAILVFGGAMIVGLVVLIILWAFTEELPRANRVPLYEQLEEGEYAVRLIKVGRRKLKATRVVNEVIGGDFGAAMKIMDALPIVLIEGISEASAAQIVEAFQKAEAEAEIIDGTGAESL
jgi:ribosomal protein L7/L12